MTITPTMARVAALAVTHKLGLKPEALGAATRHVIDHGGPNPPENRTDKELLDTLRVVQMRYAALFADPPKAAPGRNEPRDSLGTIGMRHLEQGNAQAIAKEASRDRSGVEKYLQDWAEKNRDKLAKITSAAIRLDLYETERQAYLDGRRA